MDQTASPLDGYSFGNTRISQSIFEPLLFSRSDTARISALAGIMGENPHPWKHFPADLSRSEKMFLCVPSVQERHWELVKDPERISRVCKCILPRESSRLLHKSLEVQGSISFPFQKENQNEYPANLRIHVFHSQAKDGQCGTPPTCG